jgi:FixJ family two-component response regulator
MNGLDFQEKLVREGCKVPIILMSGHGDVPMSVRGMRAGAIDFIQKPFREQDLLDAVALAIAEWWRRAPEVELHEDAKQRFASLTPREREIIKHVLAGRLSKQVAYDLSISLVTVKIHRASAMRKLGVRSLVELTRLADAISL